MEELYRTLGYAKCVELSKKSRTFWEMLKLADTPKNAPVGGVVREGIAKDFVREFLPAGFGLKSGLVFEAICEIKSWIDQGTIFGRKIKGTKDRNPKSGLASEFKRRKDFLPAEAKHILFAFALSSSSTDAQVIERLNENKIEIKTCDIYAIVLRWEPQIERKRGRESHYNFDNSISRLIEWLRNLS